MALDEACVDQVRKWVADTCSGTAWLTGHPGSGMTRMVADVLQGHESVWMTPATMRSRNFLRDVCSNSRSVNGKRKVLVLDELDMVLGNEMVMADVSHVLKSNKHVPILCISKATRAALICDMRTKAELVVDFPMPTHDAMVRLVKEIARDEGLDTRDADMLCRRTPGDIQHVLQTLRAASVDTRDVVRPVAEVVERLLGQSMDVATAQAMAVTDSGSVASGVFEMYRCAVSDVDQSLHYLSCVSASDVLEETMFAKQQWDLSDAHAVLGACSALTLPRTPGIEMDKYGVVWNKTHMQHAKAKILRSIGLCRRERGMSSLSVTDLAYVRLMLSHSLPDVRAAASVCDRSGLDADACLHVMRLWSTGYKLSTHARLRQAVREPPEPHAPPARRPKASRRT